MDLDKEELEVTKNKNRIKRIESYIKQMKEIGVLDSIGITKSLQLIYWSLIEIEEYIKDKEK